MNRRILLSLPLWIAYTALEIVLNVAGLVVVGALCLTRQIRFRKSDIWPVPVQIGGALKGGGIIAWPRWAWIWSNEEDGVLGADWYFDRQHAKGWNPWRIAFYWSALRNPSNNLRFVPGINPVIDPSRIRFIRKLIRVGNNIAVTLTWQDLYSGLFVTFMFRGEVYRFWWGWKLKPEDSAGVSPNDMRAPRCGFAIQFKKVS